jgi:hypothetical protein
MTNCKLQMTNGQAAKVNAASGRGERIWSSLRRKSGIFIGARKYPLNRHNKATGYSRQGRQEIDLFSDFFGRALIGRRF